MMTPNRLPTLASLSLLLYAAIAWLSWQFRLDTPGQQRPILPVLGLFAATFGIYLLGARIVFSRPTAPGAMKVIVGAAILFRIVMLFSLPIQEVDLYRYLWDGAVTAEGISPFEYSPQQVRQAHATGAPNPELQALVGLLEREPSLQEVLGHVHFPELPTIYPASSQAVFALVDLLTPSQASFLTRVFLMKAGLIAFDLATLWLVMGLLRCLEKPTQWCLLYGWCPLLMKECAGSGHLDAIAVFLTTLTVYLAVRLLIKHQQNLLSPGQTHLGLATTALTLSLAVGAKLYPMVLGPLMLMVVIKKMGWQYLIMPTFTIVVVTTCLLRPMLPPSPMSPKSNDVSSPRPVTPHTDPSAGVTTFLKYWEMNDFLFLIAIENLKPTAKMPPSQIAWFSIVPDSIRESITTHVSGQFEMDPERVPFVVSRAITLVAFILVAFVLAWRAAKSPDIESFCEAAFLTLAWFWLLAPTQNPWYWTWALPFLPLAKGRCWIAVSGLVLLYYLRFWFDYHYSTTPVWGTPYIGVVFYDLVVPWIEFGPWMAALFLSSFMARGKYDPTTEHHPPKRNLPRL